MSDQEPTIVVKGPSLWSLLSMFLQMLTLCVGVWCGIQLWLMNQFMITFVVGTARMSIDSYMMNDSPVKESVNTLSGIHPVRRNKK